MRARTFWRAIATASTLFVTPSAYPPQYAPYPEKRFRADTAAWKFFDAQPPGYRRIDTWRVVSARRKATRERRLYTVSRESAGGRRTDIMKPGGGRGGR